MTASIIGSLVLFLLQSIVVHAEIRHYSFNIQTKTVTRICHTKEIVTVNGQYPGPTIYAREADTVLVKVTNNVKYNVSIHWHGIRQLRTGWSDGPAYITQCPIQRGQSFTYNFTITGQRGTLFWHAHILWLRATVHGAIVILPPPHVPYPFKPKPHKEFTLILGEWFNADIEELLKNATNQGVAPNASDAHTINGKPGELFACPVKDTFVMRVQGGRHYLLRIINAALNEEHVFAVAGHTLKVVEIDAVYTKPFDTDAIFIAPGQTTNVILYANKSSGGSFFMAAKSFRDSPIAIDREIATAILQYETPKTLPGNATPKTPLMAELPGANDSGFVHAFSSSLKSLNSAQYPAKVPQKIERHLFFTVGFATEPCPSCAQGVRDLATMNNISFQMPTVSLLQAHFFNISGVFTTDFPDNPPQKFNFTGSPSQGLMAAKGTRLTRLSFNSTVELVLQGTSLLTVDTHPMHLHGFSFFVVGSGLGNFDANRDPQNFNLVDPPERNTVSVPTGGWSAIRFRAANPGVWFMHCHLDLHMTWGLTMAFLVDNGPGPQQSLLPPPPDLPRC